MKKFLVALVALALSACALINGTNTAASIAINTGVTLATDIYIQHKGGGTTTGDYAVAQQVVSIATQLKGLATGTLTVAQFNTALAPYIAKLSGVQQVIAVGLLQELDLYFQAQVAGGNNILNAATQATATVVLNDVIAAASAFPAS